MDIIDLTWDPGTGFAMLKFPPVSTQVKEPRYSYLETRIVRTPKLKVACAGSEQCNADYCVERKNFACYAIEFVIAGHGEVVLNGKSWPLHPGTLFCYGPRTSHRITTDHRKPLTKFFVDFFGDRAVEVLRASRIRPGQAVYTLEMEGFRTVFEALITEGGKGLRSTPEICAAYLQVLILKTNEAVSSQMMSLTRSASSFQRCRQYIDAHFLSRGDLHDIARETHVSTAYLCRLFKKFGQPSPFQYLTRKKLNRAAELLAGEGKSVKETAFEVGYADPFHFSRLFKQCFGESPMAFAQNYRK